MLASILLALTHQRTHQRKTKVWGQFIDRICLSRSNIVRIVLTFSGGIILSKRRHFNEISSGLVIASGAAETLRMDTQHEAAAKQVDKNSSSGANRNISEVPSKADPSGKSILSALLRAKVDRESEQLRDSAYWTDGQRGPTRHSALWNAMAATVSLVIIVFLVQQCFSSLQVGPLNAAGRQLAGAVGGLTLHPGADMCRIQVKVASLS